MTKTKRDQRTTKIISTGVIYFQITILHSVFKTLKALNVRLSKNKKIDFKLRILKSI